MRVAVGRPRREAAVTVGAGGDRGLGQCSSHERGLWMLWVNASRRHSGPGCEGGGTQQASENHAPRSAWLPSREAQESEDRSGWREKVCNQPSCSQGRLPLEPGRCAGAACQARGLPEAEMC